MKYKHLLISSYFITILSVFFSYSMEAPAAGAQVNNTQTAKSIQDYVNWQKLCLILAEVSGEEAINNKKILKIIVSALNLKNVSLVEQYINTEKLKEIINRVIVGEKVYDTDIKNCIKVSEYGRLMGYNDNEVNDKCKKIAELLAGYFNSLNGFEKYTITKSKFSQAINTEKVASSLQYQDKVPEFINKLVDFKKFIIALAKAFDDNNLDRVAIFKSLAASADLKKLIEFLGCNAAVVESFIDFDILQDVIQEGMVKNKLVEEKISKIIKYDEVLKVFGNNEELLKQHIDLELCAKLLIDFLNGQAIGYQDIEKAIKLEQIEKTFGLDPEFLALTFDPSTSDEVRMAAIEHLKSYTNPEWDFRLRGAFAVCCAAVCWLYLQAICPTYIDNIEPNRLACLSLALLTLGLTYVIFKVFKAPATIPDINCNLKNLVLCKAYSTITAGCSSTTAIAQPVAGFNDFANSIVGEMEQLDKPQILALAQYDPRILQNNPTFIRILENDRSGQRARLFESLLNKKQD